jgi:hypothetical protein
MSFLLILKSHNTKRIPFHVKKKERIMCAIGILMYLNELLNGWKSWKPSMNMKICSTYHLPNFNNKILGGMISN